MSRIYVVRTNADGKLVRYVRANTLAGAIRAASEELYSAAAATTEEIFQASRKGQFDVLDALKPEQIDAIKSDELPGGRNYPRQIA